MPRSISRPVDPPRYRSAGAPPGPSQVIPSQVEREKRGRNRRGEAKRGEKRRRGDKERVVEVEDNERADVAVAGGM